jgi:transposase InsO family protein
MDLRDEIQKIALEWPCYGSRRITQELKARKWDVNRKRVQRLMREDNLLCVTKRRFVVATTDSMLDRSRADKELARRLCAAYVSYQMGVSVATQYKKTPEHVGDLWLFLAALADKLATESQHASYGDLGHLATEMIQ